MPLVVMIYECMDVDIVRDIVKEISIDESSGLNGINSKVLTKLTKIFKNSVIEGIFPQVSSCGTLFPFQKRAI